MGWWKADPVENGPEPLPSYDESKKSIPLNHPPVAEGATQDACPVDHKTRELWLQAAKKQRQQARDDAAPRGSQQQQQQQQETCPIDHTSRQTWMSMASNVFGGNASNSRPSPLPPKQVPTPSPTQDALEPPLGRAAEQCSSDTISGLPDGPSITYSHGKHQRILSHDREVSSIPRAQFQGASSSPTPSNNEQETGTSSGGNWIYPSETQFFNAVMRKATATTSAEDLAQSISSIIPIHNAVNERAWHLIKQWEGNSSKACGGPKLLSFQGLGAGALSPKAKWNTTVMGAKEPFDRHDWVVERCGGETVEYIIDFYQGKEREDVDPRRRAQELNFYLDVRPKLNSFEGWKMRAERWMGWR